MKFLEKYLYYFLTMKTEYLRKSNEGGGQPNLNTSIVKNIEFLLPSDLEQEEIISQIVTA